MVVANSQSQLQTANMQASGDYQLTPMSQVDPQAYSPSKAGSKLYKHPQVNRQTNKSYIPINSGTYSMPNGGFSDGGGSSLAEAHDHSQLGTDANIYEVTPHKAASSIYNQFVKQGQPAKMNTSATAAQNSLQQEVY